MKVLVLGATGLLGRAVVERLKQDGHQVVATGFTRSTADIEKLDLTDFPAVDEFLLRNKPDAIILAAAERRPDVVENAPEASYVLNVEVPSHLAAWCKGQGPPCPLLINISTDYVFDGVSPPYKVDDPPNPLNAYGRSKWEGEKGVLQHGAPGRCTSMRVPVLYGRAETNAESAVNILLDALTKSASSKGKRMDANAVRYPTCVSDIATAISLLCSKYGTGTGGEGIPPTLHFSAMEAMTKYDMCLVIARCLRAAGEEAETDHLEPEYEVDPSAATSRPRHCKLDLSEIKRIGIDVECISFEAWWRQYLQEYAMTARAEREKAEELRRQREQEERREEEAKRIEAEQRAEEEERKEKERLEAEREAEEKVQREEQEDYAKSKAEQERTKAMGSQEEIAIDGDLSSKPHNDTLGAKVGETTEPKGRTSPALVEDESISGAKASSARSSSLTEPMSPNPSFSSLQARPTPPATSGRTSPSPSVLSTHALPIPGTVQEEDRNEAALPSASTSLTEREIDAGSTENPVDPLYPNRLEKRDVAQEERAQEKPGFFPSALVKTGSQSSTGIESIIAPGVPSKKFNGSSGDADSDVYGHPSPRETPANATAQAPFAAGYGEVQYGLDESSAEVGRRDARGTALDPASAESRVKPAKQRYIFQIRVGDPQKIGDPMTAHIVYTVRVKTDSPHFKASQFSVLRRYSDFRWLHAALVFNNAGIFIPPVPEKVKIGRFAPDLVEARRHGLESCINKIANNPILQLDDDFRLFLESSQFQADVKTRDQVKGPVPTPEQKTMFGWSTSLTGSTYKYHEADEWFEEQSVYLDHLEAHLKNLVRVIGALSQQRKDVAGSISDLSHAFMMLSGSSLSRSLSTCFAGLGEVQRRMFELTDIQADSDIRDFGSVIYEYERMVGSARKAFMTRIDAWQLWQKFEDESRKIKQKHEKLKRESHGGHRAHDGKLTSILEDVAAIDTKCLNQKREFDLIGMRCKEEMDRFEWDRIHAFEEACELWMQGMIERNQELMAEWEQYAALLERQTGEKVIVE